MIQFSITIPGDDRHDPAHDTGYECTAYFNGRDGLGTCNAGCQWWTSSSSCPAAKGSAAWDGDDERPQA